MLPFIVYICQWINHVYHRSFAGEDWIDTCQPSWPIVHKKWRRSLSLIALLFAAIKSLRNRLAREQSLIIWSTL
ncbi:hypothetical protein DERF_005044 [Dermatophagoides farinae]|uniref:Uncharacterized protein n=1 Tax=Dermatophagoides farinae TaxID=6954 RepID=A0A922LAT2_DERFA|nr:hypothetical protein DERF_005044 [Dermatophagoides farinae]